MIGLLYVASGLLLPLFYAPQILRLRRDATKLDSYSLSKAAAQVLLRIPALLFAIAVVRNDLMIFVVALDLVGRFTEVVVALSSLRKQGCSWVEGLRRALPWEISFQTVRTAEALPGTRAESG